MIAKNGKVLRNIAIGCLDLSQEIPDGEFLVTEQAEDFKSYRVSQRLEEGRDVSNLCVMHIFHRVPIKNYI